MSLSRGELSVALLVADLADAKKIGQIFRDLGIIPHVYDDLGEFWSGALEHTPTLAMVDVRMMSEGDLLLRNHPHIKAGELPIAFIYSERTKPLLNSAHSVFNFGLVNCNQALGGQIKNILRRINRINYLENRLDEQKIKLERSDAKLERLMVSSGNLQEREHYQQRLQEVSGTTISLIGREDSFADLTDKVFGQMEEVVEFTLLELSRSGQKLVSPQLTGDKYRSVPALWLGESYQNGIELLGQKMASQVVGDLMDGEVISLAIHGTNSFADRLIFLRTSSATFMNKFDWSTVETVLTSANRYYQLRDKDLAPSSDRTISPWHSLTLLDRYSLTAGDGSCEQEGVASLAHLSVDLTDLISIIDQQTGGKFYWAEFYQELVRQLDKQGRFDYRITCSGVWQLSFLVDQEEKEQFKGALNQVVCSFSYWRFFENGEQLLACKIQPKVREIPMSAKAYLKHLNMILTQDEKPVQIKNSLLRSSSVPVATL